MALSGRYRHVVEWENRDGVSQGTARAHVRGSNANEAEIAGLDAGIVGITIRIRQSTDGVRPGPGWGAIHGNRRYNVKGSFDPTGKGRELSVVALEAVAG